jgi:hypothetical protein
MTADKGSFDMRGSTRFMIAAGVVAGLAACEAPRQDMSGTRVATQPSEPMVWVRRDGLRGSGNPILEQQYRIDTAACPGAAEMSPAAEACMAARGYALVPRSQADQRLREFARAAGN